MDPLREADSAITDASRELQRRRPETGTNEVDSARAVRQDKLIDDRLRLAAIAKGLNPFPTTTVVHQHGGGEPG